MQDKEMKIVLINPSQKEVYGHLPPSIQHPLGLAYLGSVSESTGHKVRVVDMDAANLNLGELAEVIKKEKPEVAGITSTTPVFSEAIRISKMVKEISPEIYVILGGVHPTIFPAQTVAYPSVDFVIKGEGEESFVSLVSCLETGKDWTRIEGLAYRKNGNIFIGDSKPIGNLDKIPFPAHHLFNSDSYTYPDSLYKKTFPMITSRGCPGRCTFCSSRQILGNKFRYRSPKNVVDEVEYLIKRYGAKEIHIWDDNFATLKWRVVAIREEIKTRSIKIKFAFPNGMRADSLDEEVLKVLKDMGTYSIAVGVESGNQKILDRIKKGINLEKIREVFNICKKINIETWGFFMMGLPDETKQTIGETIEFAKILDPDVAKFHILKPYPGTEVYEEFLKSGLIEDNNYAHYGIHTRPIHHLPELSSEELLYLQGVAYRKFYFSPPKILKQVLRMKSINRLKLNLRAASGLFSTIIKRTARDVFLKKGRKNEI